MVALQELFDVAEHKGYAIFDNAKGYDLNIWGVRNEPTVTNEFDDTLCVFWKSGDDWTFISTPITTDPGSHYLWNPASVKGTAVMVPNQYRGAYKLGKHKGRYDALRQTKPMDFYRLQQEDNGVVDFGRTTMDQGVVIGANIHRASETRRSTRVDKWSAGCQVIPDPFVYQMFMDVVKKQVDVHGWDTFTYTLIMKRDIERFSGGYGVGSS
jgi:hypothetical protein